MAYTGGKAAGERQVIGIYVGNVESKHTPTHCTSFMREKGNSEGVVVTVGEQAPEQEQLSAQST